jgi:type IV pilus assembly protein PilC
MPGFNYVVKSENGREIKGEINATSKEFLRDIFIKKGLIPLEIIEKNALNDLSQIGIFKKKVKLKDLSIFSRQMAIILQAGVPIVQAMEVITKQCQNKTLREALDVIYENIQKGTAMSIAMKKFKGIFPGLMIHMVEAGEISGQLDDSFLRLAEHFEKENKMKQKIKSALTYPVVVLVIATLVIAVLMMFVVPTFSGVLTGMGVELPIYTRILIGFSDGLMKNWFIIMPLIIWIFIFTGIFIKSEKGKMLISKLVISLPVIKLLVKNIMTARFSRTLGTLIKSGVLLIQGMEVVENIIGNTIVKDKIRTVIKGIKDGKSLCERIKSIDYFPPIIISMVKVGEDTGELDTALLKSADFYEQEVESSMHQLTTLVEPLVIILLAAIVGFIMLSVLLPMFSIYQNMA